MSEKPVQKIHTANHAPAALLKVTFFRIFIQETETRKQILLIEIYYLFFLKSKGITSLQQAVKTEILFNYVFILW